MKLDAFLLSAVVGELNEVLTGARIERITMPEPETVVLSFFAFNTKTDYKLLISANPSTPRIHLTENAGINPAIAPAFCMHLRKRLTGATLTGIEQAPYERVIFLRFDAKNELKDTVQTSLIFELMGPRSNIILADGKNIISDCIKRVPLSADAKRTFFTGFEYVLPEQTPEQLEKIKADFASGKTESHKNINKKLNDYFAQKAAENGSVNPRQKELAALVKNSIAKLEKKLGLLDIKLKESGSAEKYKTAGDEILCNLHNLTAGAKKQAQENFKKYKKLKRAAQFSAAQTEEAARGIEYLETIRESLRHCSSPAELDQIAAELEGLGIRNQKNIKTKPKNPPKSQPLKIPFEGYTILAGKNNIQNDELTKSAKPDDIWLHAKNVPGSHVIIVSQGNPVRDGAAGVPKTVLERAASLAAYYSKAYASDKAEVDYTLRKYVKKPSGAKPGMVTYTNQKTVIVKPQG